MMKKIKILYAASTQSHLQRFHMPYITELKKDADVFLMADGADVDFPIRFDKHFFSFSNVKSVFRIRKILKREQFDRVVVNTTLAAFLIRSAMIGLRKRPYVKNVVHGYLFSERRKSAKEKFLFFCERRLRDLTDEILVMNDEDLRIATEHSLCLGKVSFLRGMGFSAPPTLPPREDALRNAFAPKPNEILCTYVGELSQRKNQQFLIRCVAQLKKEGISIRLLLLGEGAERQHLETLRDSLDLSEDVFLPGNREGALPYLAITDVYLSASRSEGLPFNLLEAMLFGLPIIAFDVKGQRDLLPQSQLLPPEDETAFCNALRALCKGPYGPGTTNYPNLPNYFLSSVLEENVKLLAEVDPNASF